MPMVARAPLVLACAALALGVAACSRAPSTADGADGAAAKPIAPATIVSPTVAPAPAPPADAELLAWIRAHYPGQGQISYRRGEIDLDGDGTREILAYIGGPSLCGSGGCDLAVLARTKRGLERIGNLSVSQLPVGAFASTTHGWRDLAVSVGGGGQRAGVAMVPFGDKAYASNPTIVPAKPSTALYEPVIAAGPLEPVPPR